MWILENNPWTFAEGAVKERIQLRRLSGDLCAPHEGFMILRTRVKNFWDGPRSFHSAHMPSQACCLAVTSLKRCSIATLYAGSVMGGSSQSSSANS